MQGEVQLVQDENGPAPPLLHRVTLPHFPQDVFSEEEEGGGGAAEELEVLRETAEGLSFHFPFDGSC